jgi:hypothetical protein
MPRHAERDSVVNRRGDQMNCHEGEDQCRRCGKWFDRGVLTIDGYCSAECEAGPRKAGRGLRTQSVARELAAEFARIGDIARLAEKVSYWGWHFGKCRRYNRLLFEQFLVEELGEVSR